MHKYISFIDFETTGVIEKDIPEIIEVGIVRLDKQKMVVDTFESFVKIPEKLDPVITKPTGITDKDLENAPTWEELCPRVVNFLRGKESLIVAWPLAFEMPLLQYHIMKTGQYGKFPLDRRGLDLASMAKTVFMLYGFKIDKDRCGGKEDFSQENFCKTMDLDIPENTHRALVNATMSFGIFKLILKMIDNKKLNKNV